MMGEGCGVYGKENNEYCRMGGVKGVLPGGMGSNQDHGNNTQMYIDGYQVKLVSDTSYGSLWEVSFTLKEF